MQTRYGTGLLSCSYLSTRGSCSELLSPHSHLRSPEAFRVAMTNIRAFTMHLSSAKTHDRRSRCLHAECGLGLIASNKLTERKLIPGLKYTILSPLRIELEF
jgi:hypothetical protein